MKWYIKLLLWLLVIALLPLILLFLFIAGVVYLIQLPHNIKTYKNSAYYKEFGLPFFAECLNSAEYRFFNGFKERNLPVEYIRQESNGLEYFIYEGILYLFPDFDQIDFDEDVGQWQADYDGDWRPFDQTFADLVQKLESRDTNLPVKLLVERRLLLPADLRLVSVPECIFVTWSYDTVFENEDSPLKMLIPSDTKTLYEMMLATPDLCGKFELIDDEIIRWNLFKDYEILMSIDDREGYFVLNKLVAHKHPWEITHWHPETWDAYDEVCNLGLKGNVMVVDSFLGGQRIKYTGDARKCPYSPDKKKLFGKRYFLKATDLH